jgi:17beta-estradiol 17-dehydrogenase / very-long-chain 3-oxoacyl-CoA reductase
MSITPFYITFTTIGLLVAAYFAVEVLKFIVTFARSGSLHQYNHHQKSFALVTGATGGIGAGFAGELCQQGFNVIIHGRSSTKLERIKAELNKEFPDSIVKLAIADALDRDNSSAAIDQVVASVRDLPLTVLINNIGGINGIVKPQFKSFENHNTQEIDDTIDLNNRFSMQLTNALFPILKKNEPSLVINIGSMVADMKMPYLAVYSATKTALMAWSANLGAEMRLEGRKIEVLGILVGDTSTPGRHGIPASYTVPTAGVMAASALKRVGCGRDAVPGYFPHAPQQSSLALVPGWLAAIVVGREATKLRDTDPEAG